MRMIVKLLKSFAHLVRADYALYRIYESPDVNSDAAAASEHDRFGPLQDFAGPSLLPPQRLRELSAYAGDEAYGFGAWRNGILAAACYYWVGQRYSARGFWPIGAGEAKLVHIETACRLRNQGIAHHLIRYSAAQMKEHGYHRLLARIWHSHRASIAAFENAGWTRIATVLEAKPFGVPKPIRVVLRHKPTLRGAGAANESANGRSSQLSRFNVDGG